MRHRTGRPEINLIGAAWGAGGVDHGSAAGPEYLLRQGLTGQLSARAVVARWQVILEAVAADNALTALALFAPRLAEVVRLQVQQHKRFAVIGGDHACALGTWSGAALASGSSPGLIWIDAHMDSHIPETTPSGALHGMPLAFLLGHGPKAVVHLAGQEPALLPERVCLIGVRSFEAAEAALLRRLGVRVFDMAEVNANGLEVVMQQAIDLVVADGTGFGVSIDLDAIDPFDAPAVATAVPGGLSGGALVSALAAVAAHPKLIGVEIAEFNPQLDVARRTTDLITDLLTVVAGGAL